LRTGRDNVFSSNILLKKKMFENDGRTYDKDIPPAKDRIKSYKRKLI
jgi:hypothetical protein